MALLKELPPWLLTVLCFGGVVLGVWLHLAWHPLRRHFSDAVDFLRIQRLPLVIMLAAMGAHQLAGARTEDGMGALGVMRVAVEKIALLFHQPFAPWPVALLLPVWAVMLAVRLMRHPYRYQDARLRMEEKGILIALAVLSLAWSVMSLLAMRGADDEAPDMLATTARLVFGSIAAGGFQVWLCRLVIQWERPTDPDPATDTRTALDECFARWRSVLLLALFSVLWSALLAWQAESRRLLPWSLLMEFLLVFSPLPLAVAVTRGSFIAAGGAALRALWRCGASMIGFTLTATVMIALGHFMVAAISSFLPAADMMARVIILGALQGWLLITALLLLYRGGFRDTDAPPESDS